jgi:ankyrin repeat protein
MLVKHILSCGLLVLGSVLIFGCNLASSEPAITVHAPAPPPVTPSLSLLDAVANGDFLSVTQHIEFGSNLNKPFIFDGELGAGGSPLHLAVVTKQKDIARALIEGGAYIDIRAKDAVGGTPLHWVAFYGMLDMVEFLVNSGADVNSKDNFGSIPLDAAKADNQISNDAEKLEVVTYLSAFVVIDQ